LWTPPPNAGAMCISPWPTEMCRTCGGSGWIEGLPTPENQQQRVTDGSTYLAPLSPAQKASA
jgi:hypothetical protein